MKNLYKIKNDLYIISNTEQIKLNDYITDGFIVWKWKDDSSLLGRKKVILSTDQDLIKDGVQAIDDEFLEWFINNPSCEEVEVYELYGRLYAEPIIPKEEPKQKTLKEIYLNNHPEKATIIEERINNFMKQLEPKQSTKDRIFSETSEETKQRARDYGNLLVNKQETLEEAAKNYVDYCACNISGDEDLADADKRGFIYGAKWQAERMYSEEEVQIILSKLLFDLKHKKIPNSVEWFEQFKKK